MEYTTQCAPADINRDGAPDIVVPDTSNSAGNLIWYENPRGHGGNPATDAWARRIIGSPTYWLHDVSIADLDGDGRPDVVTRSTTDNFDIVDIWAQGAPDAGGVPTWSRRQLINGPVGLGLALGDVDGDGKADLVTGGVWRHNPDWTGGRSPATATRAPRSSTSTGTGATTWCCPPWSTTPATWPTSRARRPSPVDG